ncbi:hypothetical protein [Nereida sp. MMG025]|uniref:hypothetical protein n=1 Tax=Nereida sp. MMG025 TaxID=2909981 RepID=UPI001F2C5E3A|nr:hypothetical protein [Nereida sp. MMG025]
MTTTRSTAQDTTMFDRPDNYYSLSVRAENMFARVYINGAPVAYHGRLRDFQANPSMEQVMRHGENTITIDYEPFNVETESFTPHDGVRLELAIRHETQTREVFRIDLFNGRFNPQTQRLEMSDTNLTTGRPLVLAAGTVTVQPQLSIEPQPFPFSSGRTSSEFSRRLTVTVDIDDPSALTPPFEDAPVLTDSPEMRDKLYDAYTRFYTAHVNNDRALYAAQMREVIDRFAYVRGYKGREEEALDATLSGPPLSGGEGEELRPLPSRSAFQTARLSFGSNMRMVRASDHPIMYVSSQTGKNIAGVGVFFCMGQDSEMFICHQPPR